MPDNIDTLTDAMVIIADIMAESGFKTLELQLEPNGLWFAVDKDADLRHGR